MAEDYDSNIDRAENGELVSLLEQATFALEKSTVRLSQPPNPIAFSVSIPKRLPVLLVRMVYVWRVLGRIVDLHRTIPIILDSLDLNLSSSHDGGDGTLSHQLMARLMTVTSVGVFVPRRNRRTRLCLRPSCLSGSRSVHLAVIEALYRVGRVSTIYQSF